MNVRLSAIARAVTLSAACMLVLTGRPMGPAMADGSGVLCRWPSLATWLPKAELVTVVRVERIRPAGRVRAGRIQLTVEDVLRGRSPRHITVRAFDADGMPDDPECTSPTIEVELGDRLVMGFASGIDRVSGPVSVVAFLDRRPRIPLPGLRQTTLAEVRSILGLPATDADLPATDTVPTDSALAVSDVIETAAEWLVGVLHRLAAPRSGG